MRPIFKRNGVQNFKKKNYSKSEHLIYKNTAISTNSYKIHTFLPLGYKHIYTFIDVIKHINSVSNWQMMINVCTSYGLSLQWFIQDVFY